ncbi:hypothetical protein Golob_004381, partial [Gossypium lobatum]|nr:hypothetical protein [Gossypium lobatum]
MLYGKLYIKKGENNECRTEAVVVTSMATMQIVKDRPHQMNNRKLP